MTRKKPPKPPTSLALSRAQPPHQLLINPATREVLKSRWGPNLIANAKRKMEGLLAAAGLPTEADAFYGDHRGFGHRGLTMLVERRDHQIGSEIWYAAKILDQMVQLRRAEDSGDRDWIVHEALHLGALMADTNTDLMYGRTLDTAERARIARAGALQAQNVIRQRKAGAEHRRWLEAASLIWERRPRLSVSACARDVIRILRLKRDAHTVSAVIAAVRPPKVGGAV